MTELSGGTPMSMTADEITAKEDLTNNIGCMSKVAIEDFASMVLRECGYPHRMGWTTAGDILIGEIIYIDECHINEYPYMVKERVLHEIAHIDTWPQDDRHGEIFHSRLAELIEHFTGRSSYKGTSVAFATRWGLYSRRWKMKRFCNGCKALSVWTYGYKCWLGKKQDERNHDIVPLEDCPKPKTYIDYDKARATRKPSSGQLIK